MFGNMKLTNKIVGVLSIIILGMLFISVSSYLSFKKIGSEIEEIAEYQVALIKIVTELEKDILKEEIYTYELIIASKDIKSDEFLHLEKKIKVLKDSAAEEIKKCEELAKKAINLSEEITVREAYSLFLNLCETLEKEQSEFSHRIVQFEHNLENNGQSSIKKEKELLQKKLESMDKHVVKLTHQVVALVEVSSFQAKSDEQFALRMIEIVSLLVLLISIILGYGLVKNIRTNMNSFQLGLLGFFKYLNREESDVKLLNDKNRDEFGLMSRVINENIVKTKQNIEEDRLVINETVDVLREFEQGDLCQRVNTHSHNPALQELTVLLNKMGSNIEKNIDSVLTVLEEYSNSNYLNKVKTGDIKEHLLLLANGVNTLGNAITVMLIDTKTNGMILEDSSDILLNNVSILNNNTNKAAVSLEETSAALEEITTNISSNTEKISKMSEFAASLFQSANDGESLATKTTTSMDQINTEVNAISEAITIIDKIAFQTNILSLNAAVEAATAGEAGKGFAVVAQEVRNLASRSAEAANEIKSLVENARKKANQGKQIADKMIDGYNGLHDNIAKTIDLINEVEGSSKEQFLGVEQINDAITSLDKQTQENASIASHTNDIAVKTDGIAKSIVSDANKKEFIGKDEVNKNKEVPLENIGEEKENKKALIKDKLSNSKKSQLNPIEEIIKVESDDEWSSF